MERLLTKLKVIEPNKEFQKQSRLLILSTPQNLPPKSIFGRLSENLQYQTVSAVALFGILAVLTGLSLIQDTSNQSLSSNLDPEQLGAEAKDIQIHLSQAQYYQESAEKIEVALKETSDEQTASQQYQEKLDELLNELIL